MDDSRLSHPDFGTREEDWPDPDADSDTEEGRESERINEAAHLAAINRSIAQRRSCIPQYPGIPRHLYHRGARRQEQLSNGERCLLLSRGDLIGKALASPNLLTDDEIHDIMDWPPPEEVRANIQRASGGTLSTPTELYAKIKDAIDRGQVESAICQDELILPARRFYAMDSTTYNMQAIMTLIRIPGRSQASSLLCRRLGLDLVVLQKSCTYLLRLLSKKRPRDISFDNPPRPYDAAEIMHGMKLISGRHDRGGLSDEEATADLLVCLQDLRAVVVHTVFTNAPLEQLIARLDPLKEQHTHGIITDKEVVVRIKAHVDVANTFNPPKPAPFPAVAIPLDTDRFSLGKWPLNRLPQSPIRFFQRSTNLTGTSVVPAWLDLPDDQKEIHRAQCERMRCEAWVEHEADQAERAINGLHSPPRSWEERQQLHRLRWPGHLPLPNGPHDKPLGVPETITGLKVYRNEIGQEIESQVAIGRWKELAYEQKVEYSARARALNDAAMAAFDASRRITQYTCYQ